jgi:metal-sulfur cluster biosynthetic enzyme
MNGFAGNVIRQVMADDAGAARDTGTSGSAAAAARDGAPGSAGRYHAAVLAASSRTTHELKAGDSPRDPRYGSDDPAVDALWRALCEVADPELPISLVDLGLICDIRRDDGAVDVDLTFTASACPCMEFIVEDVRDRLLQVPDVEAVAVRDVWDPPWTTDRMTDHGRALLRSFGVAA